MIFEQEFEMDYSFGTMADVSEIRIRRRVMNKPKVFCIAFHKTGTTSLADALKTLSYRITGPNGVGDPNIAENAWPMARELVGRFDAFRDNPWPVLFEKLDLAFPGSKFILTERDPSAWIESVVAHFGAQETPMRKWIYGFGSPLGHEDIYVDRYMNHNALVKNYFSCRSHDFLRMQIMEGDGWDKLCGFLEVDRPEIDFPHSNRASSRT